MEQYVKDAVMLALQCYLTWLSFKNKNKTVTQTMSKRHFSSKRLYNLLKWVEIGSTVLAVVFASMSFLQAYSAYVANGYSGGFSECDSRYPNHLFYAEGNNFPAWSECENAVRMIKSSEDNMTIFVGIAVLLPLVFFGGGWLYRYLFPLRQKSLEPSDVDTKDVLFEKAKEAASEYDYVSAALLQRNLGTGYARACRLLDQLSEEGIVERAHGNKPRKVSGEYTKTDI
jgi:DNA segregation ATPase FtsK/SpoIIIE-like protein